MLAVALSQVSCNTIDIIDYVNVVYSIYGNTQSYQYRVLTSACTDEQDVRVLLLIGQFGNIGSSAYVFSFFSLFAGCNMHNP